jgi:hypothetical protein
MRGVVRSFPLFCDEGALEVRTDDAGPAEDGLQLRDRREGSSVCIER